MFPGKLKLIFRIILFPYLEKRAIIMKTLALDSSVKPLGASRKKAPTAVQG